MNGNTVFNFTIDRVPLLLDNTLKYNELTKDDIDYFVFHQANKFMLNTLRKICKLPKDKFYVNIENTGNTTSTTIPLALPPIEGLQGIFATASKLIENISVFIPILAQASAASTPACPAPTTATSYSPAK